MPKHNIASRQAVQNLAKEGKTNAEIVSLLRVSYRFVAYWRDRSSTNRLRGTGRCSKLDKKSVKAMARKLRSDTWIGQRKIAAKHGVSQATVSRVAKRLGLKARRPLYKPPLSDEQRRNRVAFAKREKERDWTKVMFEDEKTFVVGRIPNKRNDIVYRNPGEKLPVVPSYRHASKIQVAAGIMIGGRTELNIFSGNMNAAKFIEVLDQTIQPGGDEHFGDDEWVLMMDGHRAHTAGTTLTHMDQIGINHLPLKGWPANSPDLNPIENVWSMMVTELNKRRITHLSQLETNLKDVWSKLPQEHIDKTINSMPRRLNAVRRTKGASTKY